MSSRLPAFLLFIILPLAHLCGQFSTFEPDVYIVAGHVTASETAMQASGDDRPGYTLIDARGRPTQAGSPAMHAFGRAMVTQTPDRPILLIPVATGGTAIHRWAPGGKDDSPTDTYSEARRRIEALLARGGVLRGVLWQPCPGELSRGTSPQNFSAGIAELVDRFRTDLGYPHLPFVVGELPWVDGSPRQARQLNRALRQLQRNIPEFYTVCLQRPEQSEAKPELLSTSSAIRMGHAYARKVRRVGRGESAAR